MHILTLVPILAFSCLEMLVLCTKYFEALRQIYINSHFPDLALYLGAGLSICMGCLDVWMFYAVF